MASPRRALARARGGSPNRRGGARGEPSQGIAAPPRWDLKSRLPQGALAEHRVRARPAPLSPGLGARSRGATPWRRGCVRGDPSLRQLSRAMAAQPRRPPKPRLPERTLAEHRMGARRAPRPPSLGTRPCGGSRRRRGSVRGDPSLRELSRRIATPSRRTPNPRLPQSALAEHRVGVRPAQGPPPPSLWSRARGGTSRCRDGVRGPAALLVPSASAPLKLSVADLSRGESEPHRRPSSSPGVDRARPQPHPRPARDGPHRRRRACRFASFVGGGQGGPARRGRVQSKKKAQSREGRGR